MFPCLSSRIILEFFIIALCVLQDRQAVRFQFEEHVSTFTAGLFTLEPGLTQPVLVYVTFNNQVQVSEAGIAFFSLVGL
jgi:hypothetical protein